MITITNIKNIPHKIEEGIAYIHSLWGNTTNHAFFRDAIMHSSLPDKKLPRFYLLLDEENIIGCYGLITNDFISRHDLYPWLSSLYIETAYRGNEYGKKLLEHGIKEATLLGFARIYLTTNHHGYYEKYGWVRLEDGFDISGSRTRIYCKHLTG